MSDPSKELTAACMNALRYSDAITTLMGQKPRIYDVPPVNATKPYIVIDSADVLPDNGERIDGAETHLNFNVWSLPSVVTQSEAMAIAAAVQQALAPADTDEMPGPVNLDLTPHVLIDSYPVRARHEIDPSDGKTAHSIVTIGFLTSPL